MTVSHTLAPAAACLGALALVALGQQVVGGHALDANLRVDSSGFNAPSSRASSGLINSRYNPSMRNVNTSVNRSLADSPIAQMRAEGLQQTAYYTVTSGTNRQPYNPTTRVYAAGPAGGSFNALAAPQYNPLRPGTIVQTGSGPLTVNGASGVYRSQYKAWR